MLKNTPQLIDYEMKKMLGFMNSKAYLKEEIPSSQHFSFSETKIENYLSTEVKSAKE